MYGSLRMVGLTGATETQHPACLSPLCFFEQRIPSDSKGNPGLRPSLMASAAWGSHPASKYHHCVALGAPHPYRVPLFSSPLSCSMKHTLPLVLNARVSGVMHRVWKMAAWATLRMDRLHSRHTAQASCSLRPLSRRERMSARDTFSCQDRFGVSPQRAAPERT